MSLFSYKVYITNEDMKNERGIDLVNSYGSAGALTFLSEVHTAIYESGIYATGERRIKDRIIDEGGVKTALAIKKALILQAAYMHDEGNAGTANGITITADGQKSVVTKNELRSKTICISAMDVLKSCEYPLMYAGEY